ncbi:WD40 repeat-like protein, partial [Coemansia spiralis]
MSPSGYYVASGDVTGKVRVWDVVGEEHIAKGEYQPMAGRVSDIAWDHESQRIMAVGDGKDAFGHVFTYDSGNSVGSVMGHSRTINACTLRQSRPFRAVTCSDDGSCVFYHGTPYRLAKVLGEHTGFVHDVKYAPSDEYFVTVGSDKKMFLYDGKTGELVRQIAAGCTEPHTGSIYAVAWSPDSKLLVTSSGDRTCKFWDVAADTLVTTVVIGGGSRAPEHQQLGNLWAGKHIVSLSLSGDFNYISTDSTEPVRVVVGHQKAVTAAALAHPQTLYTASYDGRLCAWDFAGAPGIAAAVGGPTGGARVESAAASGDLVALGSLDDTLRFARAGAVAAASAVTLPAGPRSVALDASGAAVVAALQNDSVVVVSGGKAVRADVSGGSPRTVAMSADGLVAVGFDDCSVKLYTLAGSALTATGVEVAGHIRSISALAFSPDGSLLASGDAGGKIIVARAPSGEV